MVCGRPESYFFVPKNEDFLGQSVSKEMIRDAADKRAVFLERLKRERRWAYIRWQVRMFMMWYR